MIVNNKNNLAYDYRAEAVPLPSVPRKAPQPQLPQEEPKQKEAPKKRPKVRRRQKIAMVSLMLVAFVVFSAVIWRFTMITQSNQQVLALQEELSEKLNQQERLEMQLTAAQNLETIREKAQNSLGMDFPREDQIYFYEAGSASSDAAGDPQQ